MWVVWNHDTGYSDESMRFATEAEALAWIDVADRETGDTYGLRYEP